MPDEPFHPVSEKIESLFRGGGFWYERFEHEPVRTSAEAAAVRARLKRSSEERSPDHAEHDLGEYAQHQGSKSLIVHVRDISADPTCNKRFIMIVVPGNKQFDKKKLKHTFGFDDLRFATSEEVERITGGVQPGGVPPFGNLFGIPVYVDQSLFANERIIFNAGDRRISIGVKSADYRTLVQPIVADISI